jgi:hypothetical protein
VSGKNNVPLVHLAEGDCSKSSSVLQAWIPMGTSDQQLVDSVALDNALFDEVDSPAPEAAGFLAIGNKLPSQVLVALAPVVVGLSIPDDKLPSQVPVSPALIHDSELPSQVLVATDERAARGSNASVFSD